MEVLPYSVGEKQVSRSAPSPGRRLHRDGVRAAEVIRSHILAVCLPRAFIRYRALLAPDVALTAGSRLAEVSELGAASC